jgi:hypothetical protein
MATLGLTERLRLGVVRPELMTALLELYDAANARGLVLAIAPDGGTRSIATQQQLYADSLAAGNGQLAYAVATPGHSRHEYGAAFDVDVIKGGGNPDGTGTDDDYKTLADLAPGLGLTAGYYFADRGVGLKDPYHFQLNEPFQTSVDKWNAMIKAGITRAIGVGAAVLLVAALAGR